MKTLFLTLALVLSLNTFAETVPIPLESADKDGCKQCNGSYCTPGGPKNSSCVGTFGADGTFIPDPGTIDDGAVRREACPCKGSAGLQESAQMARNDYIEAGGEFAPGDKVQVNCPCEYNHPSQGDVCYEFDGSFTQGTARFNSCQHPQSIEQMLANCKIVDRTNCPINPTGQNCYQQAKYNAGCKPLTIIEVDIPFIHIPPMPEYVEVPPITMDCNGVVKK